MDGAFMFCADLVRRLPMPVRLALVPIKSIDRGGNPSALVLPDGFPLEGADVLVVEDILDTGRTLAALRAHILAQRPARACGSRSSSTSPAGAPSRSTRTTSGSRSPTAGSSAYGLDLNGLYRNLPYVTFVE